MNKLTEQEFQDRIQAIQRARKIFIESGLTNNIGVAFQLYQEVFAERERQIFLDTAVHGNRQPALFDRFTRPKCPECQSDMMLRIIPENEEGIKTQCVCSSCDIVLDSEKSLDDWFQILKIEDK
jgi:hypothetical protein